MSEAITTTTLSVLGALLVAALGYIVALLIRLNRRIRALERRDRLNWFYIQSLVAHAYEHSALPLPDPPEGWNDLVE